jgi:voltage-gated sodium channel
MLKRFFLKERNIMLAILLNAMVIFLLYFPRLEKAAWLLYLDNFFLLLFCVEALVKIRVYGWKGYIRSKWNQFDLTIVLLSLPSLLENFIGVPNTSMLLVLRLFRLVRLIRFIRFVPHITQIVAGLGRALKSSVFIVLALVFSNFMLALVTCHLFRGLAPEYFGNPILSAYSIFQLFTLEGWYEIPQLIAERAGDPIIDGLSKFYFVSIVLFGGIFGISLANAIFVDEMTFDNNRDLENKIDELQRQVAQLKDLLEQPRK